MRHSIWQYRRWIGMGLIALILVDLLEVLPPLFLKQAVDIAEERGSTRRLIWVALAFFGTTLIQGFCRYGWRMYLIRASLLAGRDLRGRFAHHVFGLSASFFDRKPIGDLMSLATNDVEAVRMAIGTGLLVFADSIFYLASVPVVMYLLSPKLTLLALVPLPFVVWIVMRNEREIHTRFEKVQESFGGLSALVQESFTGIRVIKAFAKENVQMDRLRAKGQEYARLNMRLARVQAAFGPALDFAMSMGMVLLLLVGGSLMIRGGEVGLSLGTFVAFQRYIQKMIWPMAAMGMAISYYQRSVSSSKRLGEIFSISTDVPEVPEPFLPQTYSLGLQGLSMGSRWKAEGRIEFRRFSFQFPGTQRWVLKDISLTIESGERVAFVGQIGSGKSALLSSLVRLYPVNRGMLYIDGVDVNDWPIEELRRQIGYVSQDVLLFNESVAENVAFGLHEWDEWLDRGKRSTWIENASRLASIHDDILSWPNSYGAKLGERGVNVSGGQKQRLTIARAIAKEPSILILDDALSSVDVQTEGELLRGLRLRPGKNTELIAAHRISTIRDADRIVLLDGGVIRQIGTHSELAADRRGVYQVYCEQQRLKEDLESYSALIEEEQAKLEPVEDTREREVKNDFS